MAPNQVPWGARQQLEIMQAFPRFVFLGSFFGRR